MRQISYTEALTPLLTLLEEILNSFIGLCKEQVRRLIAHFIETPSAFSFDT
jgi:hypothetical protein